MSNYQAFAVICALLLASASGAAAQQFVQDRLAIGFWVPPPTNRQADQYYRDIAEANFTLVIGGFGTDADRQLELCEKYGLKAVVKAEGPVEDWPAGEACWGYMMVDEPNASQFPELGRQMQGIYKAHPGRFGYINLFPNYASSGALGTETYDEHVRLFMEQVKPQVLSMDHYPLMRPGGDTRDAYTRNLRTMRKYALQEDVPFWNFFYSMPFNDRLDPTEAQIRWQIFTSLAHGARGVLYFCYWTPGKGNKGTGEFPKGGAIITAEGLKTRHWDEARRINAELKNMGPTLMSHTSTRVVEISTDAANTPRRLDGTAVRSVTHLQGDPAWQFVVGSFENGAGERAVLLVNHSYSYTAWPTVEFDAPVEQVKEVNKATGEISAVVDDSPELPGLQLSFGAGDGRLFVIRN